METSYGVTSILLIIIDTEVQGIETLRFVTRVDVVYYLTIIWRK